MKKAHEGNRIRSLLMSHGYGLVVTVGLQILQIPILVRVWGSEVTGIWCALVATSVLLMSLDLGAFNVIGNRIIELRSRGEDYSAQTRILNQIAALLSIATIIVTGVIGGFTVLKVNLDPGKSLELIIAVIVTAFTAGGLFWQNLQRTYLRLSGKLAEGFYIQNNQRLLAFVIMVGIASAGGGVLLASIVHFLLCVIAIYRVRVLYNKEYADTAGAFAAGYILALRELTRTYPAAAYSISAAVLTQGMTLMLAWTEGATGVVAYALYRIIGRAPVHVSILIAGSIWPRIAEQKNLQDRQVTLGLIKKSAWIYGMAALVTQLAVMLTVDYLWSAMTNGEIQFSRWLFTLSLLDGIMWGALYMSMAYVVALGLHKLAGLFLLIITFGTLLTAVLVGFGLYGVLLATVLVGLAGTVTASKKISEF